MTTATVDRDLLAQVVEVSGDAVISQDLSGRITTWGAHRLPVAVLTTSSTEGDVVRTDGPGALCSLSRPVDAFADVVQSSGNLWPGLLRLPRT